MPISWKFKINFFYMLCIFTEPWLKILDVSHLRFMGPFMLIWSHLWSTSRMAFSVNRSLNHFYTNCSIEFNVIYTENLLRLCFLNEVHSTLLSSREQLKCLSFEGNYLCKGCMFIVLIDIMHCYCFKCDCFYLTKRRIKRWYTTFQKFLNCITVREKFWKQ